MSKIQDQMRGLLGKYAEKKTTNRPASKKTPAAPTRSTPSTPSTQKPVRGSRLPEGLIWDTVEGVKVLVHPDYPNYVATKREGSPTYDLIQLAPRESFSIRVPTNGILYQFERRDHYNKVKLENEKATEEAVAAAWAAWNNQPGFYVVPGETEDPDGETVFAEGPIGDLEEAIYQAVLTQEHLKPSDTRSVLVIESKNPRTASEKQGHIWWQDEVFRGPPVDPRQRGFKF